MPFGGDVKSVIKPRGVWRSRMSAEEGLWFAMGGRIFFSSLRRTMGSTLTLRTPGQLLAEAALKVLAYTLRR
jgi:hypothetical protein